MRAILVMVFVLAGCGSSFERIDGPCKMTKDTGVAWPTTSRAISVECQEGGTATTGINVPTEEE